MTGPIVAQCGIATVEFRAAGERLWAIWAAGSRIGYAIDERVGVQVSTEHVDLTRATVEEAADALAERLNDELDGLQKVAR